MACVSQTRRRRPLAEHVCVCTKLANMQHLTASFSLQPLSLLKGAPFPFLSLPAGCEDGVPGSRGCEGEPGW